MLSNIIKRTIVPTLVLAVCAAPIAPRTAHSADTDILEQTSAAFSSLAARAMPAVVSIRVEKTVETGGIRQMPFGDLFDFFQAPGNQQFFRSPRGRQMPREFKQQGAGSGFLISDDGYILSNNHVVGDVDKITVRLHDGREFKAEVVGTDPKSEVALIKIEGEDFPTLPLADSADIKVGEWVTAIGNPFGLAETLTVGVISAKGRSNIGITDYEDFIQTDAAINPGNSGGPLLNTRGEAIGINTAIFSRSGGYMGIGFAIPINMAKYVKKQLIEKGEVIRSYLGVYIQKLTPELADSFDIDDTRGILISEVTEDTGADDAGLKAGDIILKMNGRDVESVGSFRNQVSSNPPGTELTLAILRNGREKEMDVTTGAFPQSGGVLAEAEDVTEDLGFTVQNLTPDLANQFGYGDSQGVIVSDVQYGSSAALKGIRPGNLITSVNRISVSDVDEFNDALSRTGDKENILVHVRDQRGSRFVVLEKQAP